jgi:hypothetical protein
MDLRQSLLTRQRQSKSDVNETQARPLQPTAAGTHNSDQGLHKTLLLCASLVAVSIVVAALAAAWVVKRPADNQSQVGYVGIASDRYQAVFLSNGQVYFGKLADSGKELVTLKDIWYLQVQQGDSSSQTSAEALKNKESQISLAKLGNELHGPDDSMSIAKDQILFWENMKNDSKVVKAINDAK